MECEILVFSSHAIQRMFLRRISQSDVQAVITYGEVIKAYPDDDPFPSYLLLDYIRSNPVHVVLAKDGETQTCIVVTAYIPD